MVWLNTVGSKHRLLGLRVLSHEVMAHSVVLLKVTLILHLIFKCGLSVSLFLGNLAVCVSVCLLHSSSLCGMLLLSIVEQLIKVQSLLVMGSLQELLLFLVQLLLSDLLFDPVLLL